MRLRVLAVMLVLGSASASGGCGAGAERPPASGNGAPQAYEVCGTVGSVEAPLEPHHESITALAVSPDGRRVAAGRWSDRPYVRASIWQLAGASAPTTFDVGIPLAGTAFEFSPDGQRLAVAGDQRGVYLATTGQNVFSMLPEPAVSPQGAQNLLRFSPDGHELATGDVENTITRISEAGTVLSRWQTAGVVAGVAYSPDGKLLASHVPELWRLSDGKPLWARTPEPVPSQITAFREHWVEFSPDGQTLLVSTCTNPGDNVAGVVGACQASTRLYRVSDGELLADLGGALSRRPTFSPDGQRLLAGSQVLEIATRQSLRLPVDAVLSLWLPDARIVSAERDGRIRLLCGKP